VKNQRRRRAQTSHRVMSPSSDESDALTLPNEKVGKNLPKGRGREVVLKKKIDDDPFSK